jgi:hypothetical protein
MPTASHIRGAVVIGGRFMVTAAADITYTTSDRSTLASPNCRAATSKQGWQGQLRCVHIVHEYACGPRICVSGSQSSTVRQQPYLCTCQAQHIAAAAQASLPAPLPDIPCPGSQTQTKEVLHSTKSCRLTGHCRVGGSHGPLTRSSCRRQAGQGRPVTALMMRATSSQG